MKWAGALAVAALVVGIVVTGWARSSGAAVQAQAPAGGPPPSPAAPFSVDPDAAGSAGLNVRYLGNDGQIKNLDVPDFPR